MMRSFGLVLVCLVGQVLPGTSASAQRLVASGLIPQQAAQRYSMERAWFTQLSIDPARGRVQKMRVHVSGQRQQTVVLVVAETGTKYRFTDRQLDMYGAPVGVAGAKKLALLKQQSLETLGIKATVQEQVVPDTTLLITTDVGIVQALDAETGKSLWATQVGRRDYPTLTPTITEKYVLIINGTVIYALDAANGQIVWQRNAVGVPSAGAAVFHDYVGVPMLTGELELYTLSKGAEQWPVEYFSYGQVFAPATNAGNRIIWSNGNGDITAITPGRHDVEFQLRTGIPIRGEIAYAAPDQLFAVTETGYIYSFKASSGEILWRFSTGDKTTEPPIVIGTDVFVVTKYAGMFCMTAKTGRERWWAKDVRQFVAADNQRVFGLTASGRIAVLDRRTGGTLGGIPTVLTDKLFTNRRTDRIYVASASGLLQCVHAIGANHPLVHVATEEAPETGPSAAADGTKPANAKPAPATPAAAPIDPFGTGAPAPAATPPGGTPPPAATKPAESKPDASTPPADNPFG